MQSPDFTRSEDAGEPPGRSGRAMSSEHAVERVPLSEIREGDMLQDPRSGKWIKVAQTADSKMRVTDEGSGGDATAVDEYRVYYGDGGEGMDSGLVTGPLNVKGGG